ncbi:MAG: hypothetical protein MZW92_53625 [Comamonadaceae bacterium]|nr:hypothetical protein [Comamonadaceae bacterium]
MPGLARSDHVPRVVDRSAPLLLRQPGRPPDPRGRGAQGRHVRRLWAAGLGGATGVQGGQHARRHRARSSAPASCWCGVARRARTQLLWRVRRKLIISHLFIGVVPAILIVTFFVLSGLLLFANLSSFLIRASLTDLADEAMSVARIAADRARVARPRAGGVARRSRGAPSCRAHEFAGISLAVVPCPRSRCPACGRWRGARPQADSGHRRRMAAWAGARASSPAWVPCDGLRRACWRVRQDPGAPQRRRRVAPRSFVRAVACSAERRWRGGRGRRAGGRRGASAGIEDGDRHRRSAGPAWCRPRRRWRQGRPARPRRRGTPGRRSAAADGPWRFQWVALLDHVDWPTGKTEPLTMNIGLSVPAIYQRLSASQASLGGPRSFGDLLLVDAADRQRPVPASSKWARSSWGWRWRVRSPARSTSCSPAPSACARAISAHRIPVLANDQLGELGELVQPDDGQHRGPAAPGGREEAPRGGDAPRARDPDVAAAARAARWCRACRSARCACRPREVGGDYYDVLAAAATGATACSSPTCRARGCRRRSTWPS